MKKQMRVLLVLIGGLSIAAFLSCTVVETDTAVEHPVSSYAEDRALIEDLMARYMFALDWRDLDTYAETFTEDGILDIVGMKWQGREAIKTAIQGPATDSDSEENSNDDLYPATGRHNVTNIVIKIDGDRAYGRAYWFHVGNDNPERSAVLNSYGHYEDEMVKVDGEWLFSKRVIYNEQVEEWIGSRENPSW